ncbi:MAG: FtsW/RodA/SpoVE family cell cycle protein [Patescibacteria group bacterium UBA2163]
MFRNIDWVLLGSATAITLLGIISMYDFGAANQFAPRQMVWLVLALVVFFISSTIDWRFLRRTVSVVSIFLLAVGLLLLLFIVGATFQGAQSWFNLGAFAIQPADPAKLALIIVLAKYFSRRHIEIAQIRHIIVSGLYMSVIFVLLFLQPDFGSAIIVLGIWTGIILLAGVPFRHLAALAAIGAVALSGLWFFTFADYQKDRIISFVHPLADVQGTGYNAFQSTVAVGSGGVLGKGVGYGTQSRLQFLPEHETDFIFAAFTEEWGFGGALLLFFLFGMVLYRLVVNAQRGASNFETLFTLGVAMLIVVHSTIHIGMNIGLLPVTGTTLPFMSYGGSHLLTEFLMLGMVSAMRSYHRVVQEDKQHEVVGA